MPFEVGLSDEGVDFGPCILWDPIITCDLPTGAEEVTGTALRAATEVLYNLSGRRYGTCQMSIRPCRASCFGDAWPFLNRWWSWGSWPRPLFYQGTWYNITCGGCANSSSGCSCNIIEEAYLPAPVASVNQVKVDGDILSPTAYRVDDWRILVRTDGGKWPICNDLSKSDDEVGTWSVSLTIGEEVPQLGRLAVGELMCQFTKLLMNDSTCTLPKPVQSIVRQGVTLNFLDPNEVFANGRIGLYLCDLFITTENPHGLMERARAYDVDGDRYRITNT